MKDRNVFQGGKAAGIVRLDPEGGFQLEDPENAALERIETPATPPNPEAPSRELLKAKAGSEPEPPRAAGIVQLDPEGRIHFKDPNAAAAEELQPAPPPEPEIDVEAIAREAHQRGFEEGKQSAIQAVQQELGALRQNMSNLMQRIPEEIRNGLAQSEPQLVDLSLALARKVIQTESEGSREVIKSVLKAAMEKVRNQTVIAIHLNPSDLEEIQPQFADGRVELLPDPNIHPGGCRIETDTGELDATIESQWEAVERAMKAQAGEGNGA